MPTWMSFQWMQHAMVHRFVRRASSLPQFGVTPDLRLRFSVALNCVLQMRTLFPPVSTRDGRAERQASMKLEKSVERIRKLYSLDPSIESLEDEMDTEKSTGEVLSPAPNNEIAAIFDLPISERPELPPDALLSFYGNSINEIRNFAKKSSLPIKGTKKAEIFSGILEAMKLPPDQLFITKSDILRTSYSVNEILLEGMSEDFQNVKYSLKVQYPTEHVPDANYPISHFIYISTPDEAEAVLAFLSQPSFRWTKQRTSQQEQGNFIWRHVHRTLDQFQFVCPTDLEVVGIRIQTTGQDPFSSKLR